MRNIIYKRAFLFVYKSGMLNKKTALHCLMETIKCKIYD